MLSCLIVAGSLFLSGPYETIRLDDVQRMKLIDRDLHVYTLNDKDTFRVTASEAERRPAQIVADCAARAELEQDRLNVALQTKALTHEVSPKFITTKPSSSARPVEPIHAPTPLEAECEAEHYKYGARDPKMVREICAGAKAAPGVPSEDRSED